MPTPTPAAVPPPVIDPSQNPALGKRAVSFGITSLVILVVGIFYGYASLIGAAAGSYAITIGRRSGSKTGTILGWVGLVLNGAWFYLALFSHK